MWSLYVKQCVQCSKLAARRSPIGRFPVSDADNLITALHSLSAQVNVTETRRRRRLILVILYAHRQTDRQTDVVSHRNITTEITLYQLYVNNVNRT